MVEVVEGAKGVDQAGGACAGRERRMRLLSEARYGCGGNHALVPGPGRGTGGGRGRPRLMDRGTNFSSSA